MVLRRNATPPSLNVEEVRRKSKLLIIDDHAVPFMSLFKRDGYDIERWSQVKNLSQLTEGYFDIILLDLHGVGIKESPSMQGLGVLEHIKQTDPTQLVIAYSAEKWSPSFRDFFAMADAVLDKGDNYTEFKAQVDSLLIRRHSAGYYISKMNETLSDQAILAPKAVKLAMTSIARGDTRKMNKYLTRKMSDEITVERVLAIISIAIALLR
jgi:DNA-binding response OmpR family regulator